jgi:hypothetical protein
MKVGTLLALGRVSNLPTVWTNTLAGAWLSGSSPAPGSVGIAAVALSLFYTGGMFLNDAFDRRVDARERPERPIPSGAIGAPMVFALAAIQITAGLGILLFAADRAHAGVGRTAVAGIALALTIVLYDGAHHANPLAPWLMGACRGLVYTCAASAVSIAVDWVVVGKAAVALAVYTAGVTYVAKRENAGGPSRRWPVTMLLIAPAAVIVAAPKSGPGIALAAVALAWIVVSVSVATRRDRPDVPGAVTRLIAGMCLVDAAWIGATGATAIATLAMAGLPATRWLQRRVAGT